MKKEKVKIINLFSVMKKLWRLDRYGDDGMLYTYRMAVHHIPYAINII